MTLILHYLILTILQPIELSQFAGLAKQNRMRLNICINSPASFPFDLQRHCVKPLFRHSYGLAFEISELCDIILINERITVEESLHLISNLPMILKGI
jgi:hypothetical protein